MISSSRLQSQPESDPESAPVSVPDAEPARIPNVALKDIPGSELHRMVNECEIAIGEMAFHPFVQRVVNHEAFRDLRLDSRIEELKECQRVGHTATGRFLYQFLALRVLGIYMDLSREHHERLETFRQSLDNAIENLSVEDRELLRNEAETSRDLLQEAEQLLKDSLSESMKRSAAAAVSNCGHALDVIFKTVARRNSVPIAMHNEDQRGRTMKAEELIRPLHERGLITAEQVRRFNAWQKIRIAAFHDRFSEFGKRDVRTMLAEIYEFRRELGLISRY